MVRLLVVLAIISGVVTLLSAGYTIHMIGGMRPELTSLMSMFLFCVSFSLVFQAMDVANIFIDHWNPAVSCSLQALLDFRVGA